MSTSLSTETMRVRQNSRRTGSERRGKDGTCAARWGRAENRGRVESQGRAGRHPVGLSCTGVSRSPLTDTSTGNGKQLLANPWGVHGIS
eukprot:757444-Hanusia_phi.AAC.2